MSFNFPENPSTGQEVTDSHAQNWQYNGMAWVRTATGAGVPEAPIDGIQYARKDADWVKASSEELFLGDFSVPPTLDNYGKPLVAGQLYYNTSTENQQTWTGTEWKAFSAVITVAGMKHYVWNLTADVLAGELLPYPDDYGNTPSGWLDASVTKAQIYRNGLRLIEQLDSDVPGDYTVDYSTSTITPITQWIIEDEIVLQGVAVSGEAEPALHPYVNSITKVASSLPGWDDSNPDDGMMGPGNRERTQYIEPNEIAVFRIRGGNFDQNTNVRPDDGVLQIPSIRTISDAEVEITVIGQDDPAFHPLTVYNTDREQFGTNLIIESTGAGMVLVYNVLPFSNTITIPVDIHSGLKNFTVHWGDGSLDVVTPSMLSNAVLLACTHTYDFPVTAPQTFEVTIAGICEQFSGDNVFKGSLIEVKQLGRLSTTTYSSAFNVEQRLVKFTSGNCNTSKVTSLSYFLSDCSDLSSIDVSTMDTSAVTSTEGAFSRLFTILSIDLTTWNVEKVTTMERMFYENLQVISIDISTFNPLVLSISNGMFEGCNKLRNVDTGVFAASTELWIFDRMFANCYALETVNVAQWVISKAHDLTAVFAGCRSLTTIDIANWDVSNIIYMGYTFADCTALVSLDLSLWNGSKVTHMFHFLEDANSLETFNVSSWFFTSLITATDAFAMNSLTTEAYDAILKFWADTPTQRPISNAVVGFNRTKYSDLPSHIALEEAGIELIDAGFENRKGITFTLKTLAANSVIALPLSPTGVYNFTVYWGDGTSNVITDINDPAVVHNYVLGGNYIIQVVGTFTEIDCDYTTGTTLERLRLNLLHVSIGDVGLTTLASSFEEADYLESVTFLENSLLLVTDMSRSFYVCSYLQLIDFKYGANTAIVDNFDRTFLLVGDDTTGAVIKGDGLRIDSAINMAYTFAQSTFAIIPNITEWTNAGSLIDLQGTFSNANIPDGVSFLKINTSNVTNFHGSFSSRDSLGSRFNQFIGLKTDSATKLASTFAYMKSLDFSALMYLNTSNVTDLSNAFYGTHLIGTHADISNWDVSKVENIYHMFIRFSRNNYEPANIIMSNMTFASAINVNGLMDNAILDSLDISGTSFPVLTKADYMFQAVRLSVLDLSTVTFPVVASFKGYIRYSTVTTLIAPSLVTSEVTDLTNFANRCDDLETVIIDSWDTINVTSFASIFFNCNKLKQLNPANWNVSSALSLDEAFNGMSVWETQYYSAALSTWAISVVQPNVTLGANLTRYAITAQASRDILASTPNNWLIYDAGVIT